MRYFFKGKWKGHDLDVGTAVVPGRDYDGMVSHVLVEQKGAPSFRMMTRGMVTSLSRRGMETNPTTTGDAAFDAVWVVDAAHEVALSVLDAKTRAELLDLGHSLPFMSVSSVEATRLGVIIRWPGALSVESATYFRDVVIRVAARFDEMKPSHELANATERASRTRCTSHCDARAHARASRPRSTQFNHQWPPRPASPSPWPPRRRE